MTRNAAASWSSNDVGAGTSVAADTTACSAKAPIIPTPMTRSPTRTPSTPSPSDDTTPVSSLPGVNGGGTATW